MVIKNSLTAAFFEPPIHYCCCRKTFSPYSRTQVRQTAYGGVDALAVSYFCTHPVPDVRPAVQPTPP